MDFYVFDMNFNRLGIIDAYTEAEITMKYHGHGTLFMVADVSDNNKKLLMNNDELRIITKATDLKRGYIIDVAEYEDEEEMNIIINAKSLSTMLNWRLIIGQQRYAGQLEDVLKAFVNRNAINTEDPNRKIPNLVLGPNQGIDILVDEAYTDMDLDEALLELSIKYDTSFEILMNHETKKFEFGIFQGADRSDEQNTLPKVIFAKAFDNVTLQSYIDDRSNYRNVAYVAGEGEGINRNRVIVNSSVSGFNRRELFVDARDLQSVYKDINDNEITLSPADYKAKLIARGENKLTEYPRIRGFVSEIDYNSQFQLNTDYFLGDKVSNRNDELLIITHSRIMTVTELFNREGYTLSHEFGTSVPSTFERLSRKGLR